MSSQAKQNEASRAELLRRAWPDLSREIAAYHKAEEGLARDHLGWFALVHGDEIVDVFRTATEAMDESFRRFGLEPSVVQEIRDPSEPPEFAPWLYWADEDGNPRR